MNILLNNITISTPITDSSYIDGISENPGQIISINPFKKLFPLDSLLKPFRPIIPGVKYYINLNNDHQGQNRFYDYRELPYPSGSPRVYYPGATSYYKYWVTPQNTGVNVSVKYVHDTVSINEAYSTGSKVVYKTPVDHGLTLNQIVKISGPGSTSWNLGNEGQVITGVPDSRTFSVTNSLSTSSETGLNKIATIVDSLGAASPTKPALSNKIVVRFEKYHTLPSSATIQIFYKGNNTSTPNATVSGTPNSDGSFIAYYNGTTWSLNPPFSSSQAISYPAPLEIKSISLTTPPAGVGNIIGVTEISARWVKDISSDVVSFEISKESTSSPEDILPVGNITANNLILSLAKYDESNLKVLTYNRDAQWTVSPTPNDVIYFAKNAEIKPHLKVFHSAGAVTEGLLKYDRVEQGTYYLDSHSISQYGDVEVQALDGSKQLMETLMPDLIYQNAPVTSIIMSILDSVGFTNYSINMLLDQSGKSIDNSIPTLTLWWSQNNKTVWDSIQELCRDIQMNAYFDENNILQFFTRDKMYEDSTVDWEFYYEQEGNKLPNIVSFESKEVASANQVKVLWRTPMSSLYTQSATNLWASEPSFLIAGGLRDNGQNPAISASTPAELINFNIDIDNLDPISDIQSVFNFTGYFLVNSEVFEYDAIEYEYEPLNSTTKISVFIGSEADWSKFRALSKSGSQYFKPTGKYRIKARGLFGTKPANHIATNGVLIGWQQVQDVWN